MRKVISDFYLIALIPLVIVALISLCMSVRLYYVTRWQGASETRSGLKLVIQASSGVLALSFAFLFLTDHFKVKIIWLAWQLLYLVSSLLFIGALCASCYFAHKRQWPKLAIALAIMLTASAGIEHFFHQKANTGRIACPNCSDDDEDPNPPEY